ncbi:gamma-glutamylcyclotransferase isoform X2 [Harpia harpyja]|uniref:gamma-glutamylcyclotransferase isoform X2 n=1 Tax=Harpia harpyja TaxID=202280 RepID=UPI0022B0D453|nr:gamma-glutamylcyclotransferase isoform X2 [Harpia harpyja]
MESAGGGGCFLYYAYGSNLLRERLLLSNPSAALCALARLQDFKLEFGHHQGRTSSVWHGGTATIVESPGDEVWGIVWKMNTSNLSSLDKQEGVEDGIYVPIEVNVHTQAGKVLTCRSYQMKDYVCGPPSPQYKRIHHQYITGLPATLQSTAGFPLDGWLSAWVQNRMACQLTIRRN